MKIIYFWTQLVQYNIMVHARRSQAHPDRRLTRPRNDHMAPRNSAYPSPTTVPHFYRNATGCEWLTTLAVRKAATEIHVKWAQRNIHTQGTWFLPGSVGAHRHASRFFSIILRFLWLFQPTIKIHPDRWPAAAAQRTHNRVRFGDKLIKSSKNTTNG